MIMPMSYSMPVAAITTIPEIAAARAVYGMAGLGDGEGEGIIFTGDESMDVAAIQGGIATPPVITPAGTPINGTGINWNALIGQGFNLTKQIIQTQPGVYTQQGPNGTITYRQPLSNTSNLPIIAGGTLPTGIGVSGTLNSSSIGLIAAAGVGFLFLMSMMRR